MLIQFATVYFTENPFLVHAYVNLSNSTGNEEKRPRTDVVSRLQKRRRVLDDVDVHTEKYVLPTSKYYLLQVL